MMRKKVMALALALVMVLGMSLNSFAAIKGQAQPGDNFTKRVSRVTLKDFIRLWDVANEKYGNNTGLIRKVVDSNGVVTDGTAEPVGPDDNQYSGKTIDIWTKKTAEKYASDAAADKNAPQWEITGTQKLNSIHDLVGMSKTIKFVNGKRLSDTEWVIRVDASADGNDNTAQTFRGDYYVSVLPYKWRETGSDVIREKLVDFYGVEHANVRVADTEPVEVPGEFEPVHNNKEFGPAWFFCMLFDENPLAQQVITDKNSGERITLSAFNDVIGYLVARRITRWPDWDDLKYWEQATVKKNPKFGVNGDAREWVPTPTQQARDAARNHKKNSNPDKVTGLYIADEDAFRELGSMNTYGAAASLSYDNASSYSWFGDNLLREFPILSKENLVQNHGIVFAN